MDYDNRQTELAKLISKTQEMIYEVIDRLETVEIDKTDELGFEEICEVACALRSAGEGVWMERAEFEPELLEIWRPDNYQDFVRFWGETASTPTQ